MAEEARRALGRGLAALIGDFQPTTASEGGPHALRRLPIEFLQSNPRNPRRSFAAADLDELAASIREKGIVQPIVVRRQGIDRFEIIAGERRWRAAQRAGLHEVPVVVHDVSDKEALEIAIVENVQRADLNPLEEASGYQQLIEEFGYTQGELADVIGKSRPHVANMLRLLRLPEPILEHLRAGRLSAGHARALVNATDPGQIADRIVAKGLSVRAAEALAAAPARKKPQPPRPAGARQDADTKALEKALADAVGLKVAIEHRPDGSGEVRIRYAGLEQLDEICRRLQSA